MWPPLINSHSFMQTLTNQKSKTVSSWLLIGLNLYERMWINQKRSHFWAPCCKEYQRNNNSMKFQHQGMFLMRSPFYCSCHCILPCFVRKLTDIKSIFQTFSNFSFAAVSTNMRPRSGFFLSVETWVFVDINQLFPQFLTRSDRARFAHRWTKSEDFQDFQE